MKLTIVTPNLNGMPYLSRCIASVRDQPREGVGVEHIVVDGGSRDGSLECLAAQPEHRTGYTLRWFSEPDAGMYDAINKGWRQSTGEALAWLNSDEQYLPDALRLVATILAERPESDFVYGDTLVLHPGGSLAAYRKAAPLRRMYLRAAHLYIHSSSLFVRRRCVEQESTWLDPKWRAAGDHEWMLRLLANGARGYRLTSYLSAFTLTGNNLGASGQATRELQRLQSGEPLWLRWLAPALHAARTVEKKLAGGFRQTVPLTYSIIGDDGNRTIVHAGAPTWKWPVA